MGLKLRLILVLMIPPILVVGVYGFVRVRMGQAQVRDENERTVILVARAVQVAVERALRDPQTSDLQGMLVEIARDQDQIDRLRLFDRTVRPTLTSNAAEVDDTTPTDVVRRVIESGQPEGFSRPQGRESLFHYVVPLRAVSGAIVGAMEVTHVMDVDQRLRTATWDIVVRLSLLVVSFTLMTGAILQREVLRPLFRLMEGIRNLGRGDPATPLPIERRDEFGRVAEAFNTMAAQLQTARHELLVETERTLDLEQQLRHSATLAVAGRLASGLAHEVGTPLNIISGRAEFLLQGVPEHDARREELNVIIAQIDRISVMIRSLLDLVRPVTPDIRPIPLPLVVNRLLLLLGQTARRHGVTLDVSIPDDLPLLRADHNLLQQVLLNILINGFEAARPAGRVSLVATPATRAAGAGIEIAVHDSGPGIPPGLRTRIFEPFFSTKPPGEGTGLGLPICRDILKSLRGDIRVESAPGSGTTFVVWLPQMPGAAA
jgi:signal transduction histidine kinase